MSAVYEYFKHAELSLAAYAELTGTVSDYPDKLREAGMSPAQAAAFASRWRVVEQYTHSELLEYIDEFGNAQRAQTRNVSATGLKP